MTLRYSANLSMLFADLPVLHRPRAAADAGFAYVESWWPFPDPVPDAADVEAFCTALDEAAVRLVALNLDAGDTAGGDRGLLSDPGRGRFGGNLAAAVGILERTGCRIVNALYGNRVAGVPPAVADRLALDRLVVVADAVGPHGVVVVETLNAVDSPDFPLTDIRVSAELVRRVNERARAGNAGLLVDVYHLAAMGVDPAAALREHAKLVRHVQFADAPGRGRPGTGQLDFAAVTRALDDIGYAGFVGLEYVPAHPGDVARPADHLGGVHP
jgi:hydroxypyruvate isomerase